MTIILKLGTNNCFAIVENNKISLSQAIDIALKTNPQINILKLNIETSKNDIKLANKLNNPDIFTFQNMGTTGKTEPQQIGVSYDIELFKRAKRKNLAKSNLNLARDSEKFSEYDLILKVKETYIDLLLKKSNLLILDEQRQLALQALEALEKEAKKNKTASKNIQIDIVQAKISYNKAMIEYNKAKNEVIFSQNRFNNVMNTSNVEFDTKEDKLDENYDALLTINPKEDYITFDDVKNYSLNSRYDLKAASQAVISAQENLKVIKSKLIPDIELTGGYGYQTKGYNADKKNEHGAFAGVSLTNIPLFYRYKPEIQNANLEIEKAQLKYKDIEIDAIRNITNAWEKYTIAKETLNFYDDEILKNSKELLEASIESFNKKEIDITSFLVSKRTYFSLILDYQNALSDYYLSYAALLKEMNCDRLSDITNNKNEAQNL